MPKPAGSAQDFDEVDRYFFALRIGSALALAVWLRWFAAPGASLKALALALAFVTYSVVLYVQVWRNPLSRGGAYLAVLPADLLSLFGVCVWSIAPMSAVYLGFYLLIALHAFYFGAPVGFTAATGFAVLYALLSHSLPAAERCAPEELALRIGFGFFIAGSLALVSKQLRASRIHLSDVNRQLEHRNRILEQTYRQLSIGRLAADVAHHINNPAAIIVGKVEVMRRRAERDALPVVYVQDLRTIAEAAFRIGGVIRSLLALSPRHDGVPQTIDLAGVAQGVILLFEHQAAERRIRVRADLEPGLRVYAQESALRQVILNLLCNALDAVGAGGEVAVETRMGAEPETIELRVRDDGHGIAHEHLDDVFSPFFSTKRSGDGVGLGLSQSLTIVRRLGGTLRVESTPGSGSTFIVELPGHTPLAADEEAAA